MSRAQQQAAPVLVESVRSTATALDALDAPGDAATGAAGRAAGVVDDEFRAWRDEARTLLAALDTDGADRLPPLERLPALYELFNESDEQLARAVAALPPDDPQR
jgi:hypothetical protein